MRISDGARIGALPESREFIDEQAKIADPTFLMELEFIPNLELSDGCVINAQVTVDRGITRPTKIGASWIMKSCHVGHDAQIGDGCEVAPGTVIGGYAILRDNVKVGINASILPYVCIGEGAVVGAGAVVTHHVLPGAIVAGNPARSLKKGPHIAFVIGPGELRCGCHLECVWDGCPHHGEHPAC